MHYAKRYPLHVLDTMDPDKPQAAQLLGLNLVRRGACIKCLSEIDFLCGSGGFRAAAVFLRVWTSRR